MAAASLPVLQPHPILLLSPQAARGAPPLRSSLFALPRRRDQHQHLPPFHRGGGGSVEARMGPGFSDFHTTETWVRHIFERAEGVIYTVADAAVSAVSSPSEIAGAAVVEEGKKQGGDWLSGITDYMESVLKVLKDGLSALHVPYPYGFAIILLTILVKAATFPLTKKQVESAMAMRSLQPQVKAIQERYAGNQEKIQLETARLYKLAGVNPLAGCLPTLATIPVWIGLYRALSNVANEGLLTEGFFWIPSLAGPTTIAARQSGSGISWLFPFVDGHPPLGWSDTLAYLVLPALLIVSQYTSAQMMQPTQGNDPSQKSSQALTKILPLMIGYFALSVPSGLSLYWFTNNVLSTAQQIWLQKLGGAKNPVKEYNDRIQEPLPDIQTIQPNNQKTGLEVDSVREKTSQEKTNSGGPRPGERFKQIKEQEARKRREKEAMKRAEAAKGSNVNSEESNLEIYSKSTLQVESSSVKVTEGSQSVSPAPDLLKDDPLRINGSDSKQGTKEDKTNTCSSATSNGGLSRNVDVTGAQDSPPDIQNDESVEIRSSSGNQTSEPYHEQIDQAGETDKD